LKNAVCLMLNVILIVSCATAPSGMNRAIRQEGGYGYVDAAGKVVVAPTYAEAEDFSEGLAKIRVGKLYGYVDATGAIIIQPAYDEAYKFNEGLALVKRGQQYGYIDKKGREVIAPAYKAAAGFSEGRARVVADKLVGFIDAKGKLVIPAVYTSAFDFKEGLALASRETSFGFIDPNGKTILDLSRYYSARPFSEGLSLVRTGMLYGYVDKKGQAIIAPAFEAARDFHEGLAAAQKGGSWGYIDAKGAWVVKPAYADVGDFHEGLAYFKAADGGYGYIDKTGSVQIAPRFQSAWDFDKGAAKVASLGHMGYVKPDGRYLWFDFESARQAKADFETGASTFVEDERWKASNGRLVHVAGKNQDKDLNCFGPQIYGDYQCSVKARFEGGNEKIAFGLVARFPSLGGLDTSRDYAYLCIAESGHYRVAVMRGDKAENIVPWKASTLVKHKADNLLASVCEGDTVRFYINGAEVAKITEPTQGKGYARAGVFSTDDVACSFDDFDLRELDPKDPSILQDSGLARTIDFGGLGDFGELAKYWKATGKRLDFVGADTNGIMMFHANDQLARNYRLSTEALPGDGVMNTPYGLLFNYVDDNNFCALFIAKTGTYAAGRNVDGAWTDFVPSGKIYREVRDLLSVECLSSTIRCFINGELVAETANVLPPGALVKVGLLASNDARCGFENLTYEELPGALEIAKAATIQGPGGPVGDLIYSPDGRLLAVAGEKGVAIYDGTTGTPLRSIADSAKPRHLAFGGDSKTLAVAFDDRTARIWDAETGKQKGVSMKYGNEPFYLALSLSGKFLAVSSGGYLEIFDAASGANVGVMVENSQRIIGAFYESDDNTVISGLTGGSIVVWNAAADRNSEIIKTKAKVEAFCSSRDGKRFAVGGPDGILVFGRDSKKLVWKDTYARAIYPKFLSFSPDGLYLAGETRSIWDASSGRALGKVPGRGPLAFCADSRAVATGEKDGSVNVWKLR
jgi:WD40 repeat protein